MAFFASGVNGFGFGSCAATTATATSNVRQAIRRVALMRSPRGGSFLMGGMSRGSFIELWPDRQGTFAARVFANRLLGRSIEDFPDYLCLRHARVGERFVAAVVAIA